MKDYTVVPIPKEQALPWILKKHYAKRKPQIQYAFGLYQNYQLIGVCSFGLSGNMNNNSIGSFDVLELNRLCIIDNKTKYLASFFMGKVFKLLPRPLILISCADTEQNHVGYVYQATNWIYTGKDGGAEIYTNGNIEMHSKSFSDLFGTRSKEFAISKGYTIKKTQGKHRYVYFIGSKKQKKEMKADLKYPILPYPKGESKRYDSGGKVETQTRLFL